MIPFPTSGNADRFLEFVARELIPWTEKTYRTSELRVLAGHSAGGKQSANAWDSLAEGLEGRGEVAEALAAYRKAVALAEAQHLPTVEAFRKHLLRLETIHKQKPPQ